MYFLCVSVAVILKIYFVVFGISLICVEYFHVMNEMQYEVFISKHVKICIFGRAYIIYFLIKSVCVVSLSCPFKLFLYVPI